MKTKVIVLGLDGLEPAIVEAMMARGELPHFARVRAAGSYARLATTYPAQTPVAWSTFATGTNPGGHGIFDFIRRDPQTYQPDLSLSRFEPPRNMFARPRVVNLRRGVPFWELLTREGIPSTILRCPCTFPPDTVNGRMLAGVGVPDLRGSLSTGTFYTPDRSVVAQDGEQVVHLDAGAGVTARVVGPRDTRARPPADVTCDIHLEADRAAGTLTILTGGEPERVVLRTGEWSPWVRLKFKFSALQSAWGIVRFYARSLAPLEFYASPVNFDPAAPLFDVAAPAAYGRELAARIGLFSTLGMAEDHNGLNNGRFDEEAFLAQCALVLAERERMTLFELERFREGLFFVVFDTPDRVQHMLWRFRDPEHPLFDRERAAEFAARLEEHYRWYDGLLAKALEAVDDSTLLVILSDHGFGAFRRGVHVNTWLVANGLMCLKPGSDAEGISAAADWSRTYAYALGLAGIYLNRKGREREGIVEEGTADAERVRRAVQEGLAGLPDEARGQAAIRSVSRREEIYSGACAEEAPDLVINCAPGYRASWRTALGGVPGALFEDNTRRWSGDHIIDPDCVPGVLFLNRAARLERPHIADLAPTILNFFGVSAAREMEGKVLLGR